MSHKKVTLNLSQVVKWVAKQNHSSLVMSALLYKVTGFFFTGIAMPLLLLQQKLTFEIKLHTYSWCCSESKGSISLVSYSLVEVKVAQLLGRVCTFSHLATKVSKVILNMWFNTLLSLKWPTWRGPACPLCGRHSGRSGLRDPCVRWMRPIRTWYIH